MKKYIRPDIDFLMFDGEDDILTTSTTTGPAPKKSIIVDGVEKPAVSIGIEDYKIYDRNYGE